MEHNRDDVQGRIGGQQQDRRIAGIEQQANDESSLGAPRGKESQSHKRSDSDGIQRHDKANWSVRRDSGDGQAKSKHNRRLAEDQHGIDCGECRYYKKDISAG